MKKIVLFLISFLIVNSLLVANAYKERLTRVDLAFDGVYCIESRDFCDITLMLDYNVVPRSYEMKWRYKLDNQRWSPWMYELDDFYHVYLPYDDQGDHSLRVIFKSEPRGYFAIGSYEFSSDDYVYLE